MTFLKMLRSLSATQDASIRLAQFAIKQQHLDEDLFSCVIEELHSSTPNNRVTILYFLEALARECRKAGVSSYLSMLKTEFESIIETVASEDREGAANVVPVKQVLQHFKEGGLLEDALLDKVNASLSRRLDM